MNKKHLSYPRKFRWFMKGCKPCRFKNPFHKWRVENEFTNKKTGITHALWECEICKVNMNTEAKRK